VVPQGKIELFADFASKIRLNGRFGAVFWIQFLSPTKGVVREARLLAEWRALLIIALGTYLFY